MKTIKFFGMVSSLAIVVVFAQFGWSASALPGQAQATAKSAARTMSSLSAPTVSRQEQSADIRTGTKISAQLVSSLDARNAKPGDMVVARVTKNVKQDGHTAIHKGDKILGDITSVQAADAGSIGSNVAVTFDHLVTGDSTTQLHTVLTSILSVPNPNQGAMEPMAPLGASPARAPSRGEGGGGRGGLLGGVSQTAGSTVGSTVGAAGATLGGAGTTLGATSQSTLGNNNRLNLSTPVRQVHLETQSSADQSAGMSSVLSTRKGDLQLDSGTRMEFRVAASSASPKK
jgi:hypothetical protein